MPTSQGERKVLIGDPDADMRGLLGAILKTEFALPEERIIYTRDQSSTLAALREGQGTIALGLVTPVTISMTLLGQQDEATRIVLPPLIVTSSDSNLRPTFEQPPDIRFVPRPFPKGQPAETIRQVFPAQEATKKA